MSRDIKHLHPMIIDKYYAFNVKCAEKGLKILLICTYRSPKEQDELYAQGRTKPGAKVTNARAGQSKHNYELHGKPASKAFDIVIYMKDGKTLNWKGDHPDYALAGEIGISLGLTWGGTFKTVKADSGHFEIE